MTYNYQIGPLVFTVPPNPPARNSIQQFLNIALPIINQHGYQSWIHGRTLYDYKNTLDFDMALTGPATNIDQLEQLFLQLYHIAWNACQIALDLKWLSDTNTCELDENQEPEHRAVDSYLFGYYRVENDKGIREDILEPPRYTPVSKYLVKLHYADRRPISKPHHIAEVKRHGQFQFVPAQDFLSNIDQYFQENSSEMQSNNIITQENRITNQVTTPIKIERICNKPLIERWGNFASDEECKLLIKGVEDEFQKSFGFVYAEKKGRIVDHRTSSTSFDKEKKSEFIRLRCFEILKNRLPNLELDHVEPVQVTRYAPGEFYKQHYDFFNNKGVDYYIANDRRATVIVYLNDDYTGGSTKFQELPVEQQPKTGLALFWEYNYDIETNRLTLHSGEPVLEGVKFIAQAFIRNGKWPDGTRELIPKNK